MRQEKKYLFGPVASRRLGLSLGVDIVPFKVCTLDCVYCQLGRTVEKSIERKEYVGIEPVIAELKQKINEGLNADYITISGSGEPTLNCRLGEFIDAIKKITKIPVAVLTNGTLLYLPDVRADCAKADLVIPSLDAGNQDVFEKINRPHSDISFQKLIDGLCEFRKEFSGPIWLEVFLIEGINTSDSQIAEIKSIIKRIHPDKIQLNTAERPTAETNINKVSVDKLNKIAGQLGPKCEVIADFSKTTVGKHVQNTSKTILSVLKRRPCSIEDICAGLNIHRNEAIKYINHFQNQGVVVSEERQGVLYFKIKAN